MEKVHGIGLMADLCEAGGLDFGHCGPVFYGEDLAWLGALKERPYCMETARLPTYSCSLGCTQC